MRNCKRGDAERVRKTLPLADAPPVGLSLMTRSPSCVFRMIAPIPTIAGAADVADAWGAEATASAYIAAVGKSGFGDLEEA